MVGIEQDIIDATEIAETPNNIVNNVVFREKRFMIFFKIEYWKVFVIIKCPLLIDTTKEQYNSSLLLFSMFS